jgi:hypothetical protein
MADIAKAIVREPAADTAAEYRQRINALALIYFVLFFAAISGITLIVWRAHLLVSLTQHSNVETLVLAFFVIFFGYVALISRTGATGALKIAFYNLALAAFKSREDVERLKAKALGPPRPEQLAVAFNLVIERNDAAGQPFEIEVADSAGPMGALHFDGARVIFAPTHSHGSNNIFAYIEHQINKVIKARGESREVDIIHWKTLDDESTEGMLSLVDFARNLERHLGADELWPKVKLTDEEIAGLQVKLSEICSALRDESFLPDWEYSAEHKLPLIPEPLGLASLSRSETRADPLATMGFALTIVLVSVGILGLLIAFPPWVPGK